MEEYRDIRKQSLCEKASSFRIRSTRKEKKKGDQKKFYFLILYVKPGNVRISNFKATISEQNFINMKLKIDILILCILKYL